jgi:DNA-binding response OmpR family regulator
MPYSTSRLSDVPDMPDFARRALVLVQDDSTFVDSLACMLTLEGFVVLRARTLAEARAGLTRQPDFVLADLTAPDGSGLELIRRIRRRNDPVVVAVVVAPGERAERELEPLYPDVIFRKPVGLRTILAWLFDTTTITTPAL